MNGKMTFRERFMRFMSGRNGMDRFGQALFVLYIVLFVINLIFGSWILSLIIDIIIVYSIYRMLSRNCYKRQRENAWYCEQENKVRAFIRIRKRMWNDRHTHVYRQCPCCKKMVRLPKIKGKHIATCPSCHRDFNVRV